jgi:hypothetical protein
MAMSSGLGAEQLGHVTMFIEDRDGPLARSRARPGDQVSRLPGLLVHLALVQLAGDAIAAELRVEGAHWPDDHPLGIAGDPAIKIASPDPKQAAADLAVRAGRPAYEAERSHLNAVGYGVRLDGYAVEFVGSATGSAQDLVGGFLVGHGGPGIFATTYRVRDLSAARAALAAAGVPFTQWGRHSLLLRVESGQPAASRIELTDED